MENCQLCLSYKEERLVKENDSSFSVVNIEPLNNSHIMVLPKRHVKNLNELTEKEAKDILSLNNFLADKLQQIFNTKGSLTIMNHGSHSSQEHLHFHIIAIDGSLRHLVAHYLNVPRRKKLEKEELNKLANYIKENL